jgi:transposase
MRKNAFRLNQDEIEMLEKERERIGRHRDPKYDRRLRGLLLVGRDGKSQRNAAEIIELDFRHFQRVIRDYRDGGIEAIKLGMPPGRPSRLSGKDKEELRKHIEKSPTECGYDSGVWDGKMIGDLIRKTFSATYKRSQINRLLHQIGFTYQYPSQKLHGSDEKKQKEWLLEFEELKKTKKR